MRMINPLLTRMKVAAVLELALAIGMISFWIVFFTSDLVQPDDPRLREAYLAFESAFPVPDACLALVLIIGGVGLLRRKSYGRLFSLMGGASLVFLGLLDVSFNIQHGIYSLGLDEAVMNLSINLLSLGTGVFLILTIRKSRL